MSWKNNGVELDYTYYHQLCFKDFKALGGVDFNGNSRLSRTFLNLPAHSALEIQFDLLLLNVWSNNNFKVFVDGTAVYNKVFTFSGSYDCDNTQNLSKNLGRTEKVIIILPHTSTNLDFGIQTDHSNPNAVQVYAIKNFKLFVKNSCDPSCRDCDSSYPSDCTSCPFFSIKDLAILQCNCMEHFYLEVVNYTRCEECDISCKACRAGSPQDCTSCYDEDFLTNGECKHIKSIFNSQTMSFFT